MVEKAQTYANHRRFVPLYHFVLSAVLLINLLWCVVRAVRAFSFESVWGVVMALALVVIAIFLRTFPLTVQDRVIRLEMRLRLRDLLSGELRDRIGELKPAQLIALRFASDAELPDLVREVLSSNIEDRDVIKRKIKDWKADHLRC